MGMEHQSGILKSMTLRMMCGAPKLNCLEMAPGTAGAAGVGDFVYRIAGGGSSNTLIRDWVDVYDINSNSWKSEKNFHRGLHAPATVTYGKSVFVLGGYSDYTEMDSVWIFDTDNENLAQRKF
jgi:hypothetical protein